MDVFNRLIVVAGPTACGKTSTAVSLANQIDGEIVCADSMQIYSGLSVGTASPGAEERDGVPHHLFGFVPPSEDYNLARYCADAKDAIVDIQSRGKTPILCGGTGLYISALVSGLELCDESSESGVREKLDKRLKTEGIESLYNELEQVDPHAAKNIHINNKRRVVRYLELYYETALTLKQRAELSHPAAPDFQSYVAVMRPKDMAWLRGRISERVDGMLESGLLKEAQLVFDNKDSWRTAAQAIGYKEFFPYFSDKMTVQECAAQLKIATGRYAKRQMTWFKRMENAMFYDVGSADEVADCYKRIYEDVSSQK